MTAKNFLKNTTLKKEMLENARYITNNCEYVYNSYQTNNCKIIMKEIQSDWKKIGSAGNQERVLWQQFKMVQDIFWKKIKIMNMDMKILELSNESSRLRDDYEIASSTRRFKKADRLYEAYERKEDKVADVMDKKKQIEQELQILQGDGGYLK